MIENSRQARRALEAGAFAGVAAGLFLTLLMSIMSAAAGHDVWYGIKGAAAPFFGARAMHAGFDFAPVVVGLIAHLAISAIWGALFGPLVYGWSNLATLGAGVAYAFVVWFGMYYVLLPMVGLARMRADAPVGRAILFHLFFSVPLALAVIAYRRIEGGRRLGPRIARAGARHAL
jgi:hypothetical protein